MNKILQLLRIAGMLLADDRIITPEVAKEMFLQYKKEHPGTEFRNEYDWAESQGLTIQKIDKNVDKINNVVSDTADKVQKELLDKQYMDAVSNEDMDTVQKIVDKAVNNELDIMRFRWETEGISSFASASRGDITLSEIRIPKNQRGQGIGSSKMRELLAFAQKHRMRVLLTPSIDFGASSKSRLESFYRALGFEKNAGRNKDYTTRETMIWKPKGYDRTDVVIYDDDGNVIPLSQRFNQENDDIRY